MLKNIPPNERPQERLERLGASALSERELISNDTKDRHYQNHVLNIQTKYSKAGSLRPFKMGCMTLCKPAELVR